MGHTSELCYQTTFGDFTTSAVVINNPAWWQVVNGDVTTNGSISSTVPNVPAVKFFDIPPTAGGFPGVPVYGSTFSHAPGGISLTPSWGWNDNTPTIQERDFSCTYFKNLIPANFCFHYGAS